MDKRRLRLLLKQGETDFINQRTVQKVFKLKPNEGAKILTELEKCGYIEPIGIDGCWGISIRGKILANKIFERSYTVNSLIERLQGFGERIDLVNSSAEFPHFVKRVKIISKYPIENRSDGIKIIFSLERKKISENEYDKRSQKLQSKTKRDFFNMITLLAYPEIAVHTFLKNRSSILKLRQVSDQEIENFNGHLFFEAPEC